jgi:hypothetical protein
MGPKRLLFLMLGALSHLAIWLIVRPDRAGPQWQEGRSLEVWLGLEALLAVAVGVLALDRRAAVVTIAAGWLLQAVHFAVWESTTTTRSPGWASSSTWCSPGQPSDWRSWPDR